MHAYWVPNQSAQCPLNTTVYICGNIVKKFIKMLSLWRIMSRWQFGKFPSSIYKVMSMMGLAWCLRYLQLIECNVKCAEAINDQIFSWSSLNKEKFPSKKNTKAPICVELNTLSSCVWAERSPDDRVTLCWTPLAHPVVKRVSGSTSQSSLSIQLLTVITVDRMSSHKAASQWHDFKTARTKREGRKAPERQIMFLYS